MRTYSELLSDNPAWPELEAAARESTRVTVLPPDRDAARLCLANLQVTTRSTLGALAHETGGLLVDGGWLRLFGCGHERLRRVLASWNEELGIPIADYLLVGDDVIGGAFAINGGALGPTAGSVFYLAPDSLSWENIQLTHSAFVRWVFAGDLESFYEGSRWSGWRNEIEAIGGDQSLSLYPPPWTKEGKDLSKVSRRPVAAGEVWAIQQEVLRQLG